MGLGNPGRQYAGTRHNLGFELIDRLAVRLDAQGLRLHSHALVTTAQHEGRKILLAKAADLHEPLRQVSSGTGRASTRCRSRTSSSPMMTLIFPLGSLRLRPGGGPGGQKGVKSTIEMLGSQDFSRLRLGIGRPPGQMDPSAYVLQEFSPTEQDELGDVLDRAVEAALAFVTVGIQAAMNRFNGGA